MVAVISFGRQYQSFNERQHLIGGEIYDVHRKSIIDNVSKANLNVFENDHITR